MFRVPSTSSLSRRSFIAGAAALGATAAIAPAFASPSSFIDELWAKAKAAGVSRKIFDAALGGFTPVKSVQKAMGAQPEFVSTAADYIEGRVNAKRIGTGQSMRGEWAKTLAAVSSRYEVQPEMVLSIWGMETDYGAFLGGTKTTHALATLAYSGRRTDYFEKELVIALQILQAGHVAPNKMIGSWAGAMGHPQFMPSAFMRYAVDFGGDGHKDIWGSIPDAQASTANYLDGFGWRPGQTWGYEVHLPKGFNYGNVWSNASAPISDWKSLGVIRVNGKPFPRDTDVARLVMPMGGHGPVFAVLPNFAVIKKYNASDSYALAVGHLADRIIGGGDFLVPWPKDKGLGTPGKVKVQTALLKRGYAIGTPDGKIGSKTRAAIMDWQAKQGLLPDGFVGGNLLAALT